MRVKVVGTAAVVARINATFASYEREAYNIAKFYAGQITAYFMQVQGSAGAEQKGAFWTNHTFKAVQGFFAQAYQVPGANIGITLGNTTSYTKYLEENYGGKYAALPTLIERFYPLYIADLKRLYGDTR